MKKLHRIVFSIIWFISVFIPYIIMRSHAKFPYLDSKRLGWLIPIFFVLPALSLLLSCFTMDSSKISKALNVFNYCCAGIYLTYLFAVTFGFRVWRPALYPISSKTDDSANYLIIEDSYKDSEYNYINSVFPDKIPDSAENIEYNYYCNVGLGNYRITAKWKLNKKEYESTKKQIVIYDENIRYEGNVLVYTRDLGNDKYINETQFNDKESTVTYYLYSIG